MASLGIFSIILKMIMNAKVLKNPQFLVILHPYLTKVDSRHDSTNHASMFLDEPSGKAERVLAAPGIRIVYEVDGFYQDLLTTSTDKKLA